MMQTLRPERTSSFLMANLGAEVSRIISAKKRGNAPMVNDALKRAESIISQLLSHDDMRSRLEELRLLSEALHDFIQVHPTLNIKPQHLQAYFLPFALRMLT